MEDNLLRSFIKKCLKKRSFQSDSRIFRFYFRKWISLSMNRSEKNTFEKKSFQVQLIAESRSTLKSTRKGSLTSEFLDVQNWFHPEFGILFWGHLKEITLKKTLLTCEGQSVEEFYWKMFEKNKFSKWFSDFSDLFPGMDFSLYK